MDDSGDRDKELAPTHAHPVTKPVELLNSRPMTASCYPSMGIYRAATYQTKPDFRLRSPPGHQVPADGSPRAPAPVHMRKQSAVDVIQRMAAQQTEHR